MSIGPYGGSPGDELDPFPPEFAELTIGTAINADQNKLLPLNVAFKMGLLQQEELLASGQGHADSAVWGSGSTVESQEAWGVTASAGAELNLGIIDALAKFHITQVNNACRKSSDVKIRGTNTYSGAFVQLLDGSRTQFLRCATDLFRELITQVYDAAKALESATDPASEAEFSDDLTVALMAFYEKFGTGCVDRVELRAIGVFEATLHSSSDYAHSNLDIGGEFSLSLPGFSAGAAAKFCQEQVRATAATEFLTRAYGNPPGCPPHDWAEGFHKAFAQNGIAACTQPAVWHVPMSNAPSTPPELVIPPPQPIPDIPDLPKIGQAVIAGAVRDIQYKELNPKYKEDGLGGLLDRDAALRNELATLAAQAHTEVQINDRALGALAGATISNQPDVALSRDLGVRSPSATDSEPRRAGRAAFAERLGVGAAGFSGYAVTGYRYRPWSQMFPELKVGKVRTRHQVVFLQSMVWYSIRGVFAQYLEYCANYPNIVGPGLNAQGSADKFRSALEAVGEIIDSRLRDKTADNLTVIEDLERELHKQLGPHYSMRKHYEFWVKNYEWLKRIPFGVVAVAERDNKHWIQVNPYPKCPYFDRENPRGCKAIDTLEAETLLRENTYRLYPIISTTADGEPHFVWVGAPSLLVGGVEDQVARVSGLLSLTYRPEDHPGWLNPEVVRKAGTRFSETTLPMLIQQSAAAAEDVARAEEVFTWPPGDLGHWWENGASGAQRLAERWGNRKAMFGLNLYPGFGDEDGFGADFLLTKAAELAREASRHNTVLPHEDDIAKDCWRLRDGEEKGPWAAYFPEQDATFFWGPGPDGWDRFTKCAILLVPIDYDKVKSVGGTLKSGGRPMWSEPRTKELLDQLDAIVKQGAPAPAG